MQTYCMQIYKSYIYVSFDASITYICPQHQMRTRYNLEEHQISKVFIIIWLFHLVNSRFCFTLAKRKPAIGYSAISKSLAAKANCTRCHQYNLISKSIELFKLHIPTNFQSRKNIQIMMLAKKKKESGPTLTFLR